MTQPEALRLADMLENNYPLEPEAEEAAAGLRRLHEENERLRQALAQPEQEPVAWVECAVIPWLQSKDTNVYAMTKLHRIPNEHYDTPLYTAPPKREWVGVTYDEVYEFVCTTDSYIDFAKAIEAKLKEKNSVL